MDEGNHQKKSGYCTSNGLSSPSPLQKETKKYRSLFRKLSYYPAFLKFAVNSGKDRRISPVGVKGEKPKTHL
jgi:hypothetical protein